MVQVALARQAQEWESEKTELTMRMEAKSEHFVASNGEEAVGSRKDAHEKELNRRAAKTVSKQQLDGTKKVRCRAEEGGKGANLDAVDTDSWPMGGSARQRKWMLDNHHVASVGEY
jgi:hypothetical protein